MNSKSWVGNGLKKEELVEVEGDGLESVVLVQDLILLFLLIFVLDIQVILIY